MAEELPAQIIAALGDMPTAAREILYFWFIETAPEQKFAKNPDFDAEIRRRFAVIIQELSQGRYKDWLASPGGAVAACIALDQFPRNAWRDTPEAFAYDDIAREIARHIRDQAIYTHLPDDWRVFCFLPFMHSEDIADQNECIRLGKAHIAMEHFQTFALKHQVIIARFGRFPHRNAILGRDSSPEELAFLQQPDSSF